MKTLELIELEIEIQDLEARLNHVLANGGATNILKNTLRKLKAEAESIKDEEFGAESKVKDTITDEVTVTVTDEVTDEVTEVTEVTETGNAIDLDKAIGTELEIEFDITEEES